MTIPAAIFFDIDGTLVDSNDLHVDAWDQAFREAGFAIDRDALHSQVGKGGDTYVPALLPHLPKPDQQALAERHGEIFKSLHMRQVQPFPGASATLARAHERGIRVVLASSAGREELDHYVALLGVESRLAATVSKDDVARSKPHPDIFRCALAKTGLTPSRALVVGDSPFDIEAARSCGIAAVALLSGGFAESRLRAAGAIAVYPAIADFGARGLTSLSALFPAE